MLAFHSQRATAAAACTNMLYCITKLSQVVNKTLELIQSWGEAFLPQRRELPLFVDTYHLLKKEGMPFDTQYKADRPPVLAPTGGGSLLDQQPVEAPSQRQGGGSNGE
jgi:hypothetical protein